MTEKQKRGPRIGRLDSIGGIATELGRVYRQMRKGEIEPEVGAKLAYVLTQQRQSRESEIIEEKIKARLHQLEGNNDEQPRGRLTHTRALPNFPGRKEAAENE